METIVQRSVAARGAARPATSAPASVFDIAKKQKQAYSRHEVDVDGLQIRKGVPMPDATRGTRGSKYKALLERMQPGDSVVLPTKAAQALLAAAKKQNVKAAIRAMGNGNHGVWKL